MVALRQEAEALRHGLALLTWDNLVHGAPRDASALFERHAALFEPRALEALRRALRSTREDPEQARSLEMLDAHLLERRVARATRELDDRIANLEASASVEVDGSRMPFRRLFVEVISESDPERRRRLQAGALPVLEKSNALRRERQRRALEEARALGCADLVELAGRVRQCDLRALAPLAEEILSASIPSYESLLAPVVEREAGVALERARPVDLIYLVRGRRYERFFPSAQLLPSLRATLRGLGIRLEAQGGLTMDSEERPTKAARAFCLPVRVPDDVRLSFRPTGGPFDYDCLYHEMGHAQHYLNTREQTYEFRYLGSMAVAETYAGLFEGLTAARGWLRRVTAMPDRQRQELRVMRAFRILYLLRRYAARMLYELGLHGGDLEGAPEAYGRLMERALGLPLEEADGRAYLADVDDLFYCAEYVRGWLLEAALEKVLRVKYGESWFDQPGSGAYLMRLWEKGGRYRAEELLEKLGQRRWSLEPVLARVQALCA